MKQKPVVFEYRIGIFEESQVIVKELQARFKSGVTFPLRLSHKNIIVNERKCNKCNIRFHSPQEYHNEHLIEFQLNDKKISGWVYSNKENAFLFSLFEEGVKDVIFIEDRFNPLYIVEIQNIDLNSD